MSGGCFDYQQYRIEDITHAIEEYVRHNDRNYPEDIIQKFKEAIVTLRKGEDMAERIDYLLSDDDGEDSFRSRWQEEVVDKHNQRKEQKDGS
jgi:hypothetical protein